ncbi:hypothetical protein SO802_028794 [Lithocarpus litseifolius]|uniref:Uncharacterized protein n=1 Tax=Lithocarpus litseifolius TaxID=425828 RepID=A0AAW2BUI1_9ROSI
MERIPSKWPRPLWHAPWKTYRVISGHLGWVRSIAFDPSNTWFCTGSADRTIKVWDIRSKQQIHALSGHDNTVCSVFTRPTDPQVVTGSHDTAIKFWDLRFAEEDNEARGEADPSRIQQLDTNLRNASFSSFLDAIRDHNIEMWEKDLNGRVVNLPTHEDLDRLLHTTFPGVCEAIVDGQIRCNHSAWQTTGPWRPFYRSLAIYFITKPYPFTVEPYILMFDAELASQPNGPLLISN